MSSPRPRLLLALALPLTSPFAISLGLVLACERGLESIELSRDELYVFACINLHVCDDMDIRTRKIEWQKMLQHMNALKTENVSRFPNMGEEMKPVWCVSLLLQFRRRL